MQAAPRALRATIFRQAPRIQASHATSSSSSSPSRYPSPSTTSSAPWTPSLRYPVSHVRGFGSSSAAAAQHAPDDLFETAPLFERVQQSPEVIAAIENMAKVTREKTGVDLAAGDKPSMSMMLKLARDPELRAAAERLMAALRGAGVEVDPKVALQALQMMGGEGFEGLKNGLSDYHEKVRKDGEGEGEGEGEGKK
ncbi:hypothetical protein JCM3775_001834 [Rhodotorula graminis]|uniref:Uncharacterized protein n=1 Tax=Rhodotorula graminis (strain WP1) TaxID=578459 RepID=A0A194S355_RHOGW|nr:uncharacterized protein RHOBADRAFT_66508 [Rhodotorula graminis WP1]KPV74935.1 hypothetical protein RHOBADRAFT_66508 [Rhodotorula graminis WP1]